jgi:hypothetical protein
MPEIDWNVENTRILCALLAEQVEKGNRPNTFLNSVGYAEVEKGFKDRVGIELVKGQIKNKWDKLKEDFKAWKKLTICFRGIVNIGSDHWNPCANTSTMAVDEEAAVSRHASDTSTFEASFVTMDAFRDSLATSIALAWN